MLNLKKPGLCRNGELSFRMNIPVSGQFHCFYGYRLIQWLERRPLVYIFLEPRTCVKVGYLEGQLQL